MSVAVLYIKTEGEEYCGHDVYLGDYKIGYRAYDGSWSNEVVDEVAEALAEILREKLGWPEDKPEEDY